MNKLYQVDVASVPADGAEIVKALRLVGRMSLREARDVHAYLVESGGGTVVAGVALTVAEHIARELVTVGAAAVVAESSVRSPSRCDPAAAAKLTWTRLRAIDVV